MQSPTSPEPAPETSNLNPNANPGARPEPDFSGVPRPIADFAGLPDFPQCALGAYVDIGGFAGVVADIVKNSIKIRAPDGLNQSFNFHRLRTIYGPAAPKLEPMPSGPMEAHPAARPRATPRPAPEPDAPPAVASAPKRELIADPDFSQPVVSIRTLVGRADFPKCALGLHIEIVDYTGVVVELVNQSLKVLAADGGIRSYNAMAMRKLHGGA